MKHNQANTGHGHVFPRPDGVKARCGGPGLCTECAVDAARASAALAQPSPAQAEQAEAEAERPEVFGLERYRVERTGQGFWPYCVRAGDGTRELFVGHLKQCKRVAAQLATAFEDGKFVAGALRAELETERMRLAGCGVAALGYFDGCADAYKSASLSDVLRLRADCDAALARVAELERGKVYVEARQCDECQHGGINDSATGVAACHECDWTGPEPEEDRCPGCQRENCMAAACPQCGARYVLVASEEIAAPVAPAQHSMPVAREQLERLVRILDAHNYAKDAEALMALLAAAPAQAQHSVPDDVETFLNEVRAELVRARSKFPGDRIMTIALAEAFGELCKAVLDEPAANVRKEAVQTAVMAARVVLDGDGSVTAWRAERGLDPLAAPGMEVV